MINKCIVCGKEFEAQKSTKKYCSRSCENKMAWIRKKERKQAIEQGINYDEKTCLICGKKFIPKDKNANQRSCCYECMPEGIQLRRSDFIDLLRQQQGGKCQRCGYDKYLGALDFHHINPSEKDFTIGNSDFRLKECVEEVKKCVLLCFNCHRELHAGLWDLREILNKENYRDTN